MHRTDVGPLLGGVLLIALAMPACGVAEGGPGPAPSPPLGEDASARPPEDAGDSEGSRRDSAAPDAPVAVPFALTSPAFAEAADFPKAHMCTSLGGSGQSPALAWTPGPAGTRSYALIARDLVDGQRLWNIYDVAADRGSLPPGVPYGYEPGSGAHQPWNSGTYGYVAPCSPYGFHTFEFVLHALDVPLLPGADKATTAFEAEKLIKSHSIGQARLTAILFGPTPI